MVAHQYLPVVRGPVPLEGECTECPLATNGRPSKPVTGYGPPNPRFVAIGHTVGGREVVEGRPLVGPSGKLFNKALGACGVDRNEVYVTNTSLCLPFPGQDREKVIAEANKHCYKRFVREIQSLQGSPPMILFGKQTCETVLENDFKITELAGAYHEVQFGERVWLKKINDTQVEVLHDRTELRQVGWEPNTKLEHWHPETTKIAVIPTIHPAAIVRGASDSASANSGAHATDLLFWNLIYDVAKVKNLSDGTQHLFSMDIEWEAVDPDRADQLVVAMIDEIRAAEWFASDTETYDVPADACTKCFSCNGHSALEPMHAQLKAIGIGTDKRAISVYWPILHERTRRRFRDLLGDTSIECVFHNRGYDEIVLECNGLPVAEPIGCTQFMHHNAFPGLVHKLQRIVTQFNCIRPWKAEYRHGQDTVDNLLRYNAIDTLGTARIRGPLKRCMARAGGEKTYAIDMQKMRIAKDMQLRGIPVDLERNQAFSRFYTPIIEKAKKTLIGRLEDPVFEAQFREILCTEQAKYVRKKDSVDFLTRHAKRMEELDKKWEGLNLNSTNQVVAFLKACGVPLTKLTKTGRLTTKKDVLEELVSHAIVQELLRFRASEKLNSTFVEPIPFMLDKGLRLHAQWQATAITGRFRTSPNCFDGQTEILTRKGWIRFDELPEGLEVGQFDVARGITWATPSHYIKYHYDGKMVSIANARFRLLVTPDHRMLVKKRSGMWETVPAIDLQEDRKIYHGYPSPEALGQVQLSSAEIAFICAAQADGSWNGSSWIFRLVRRRKIERLRDTLKQLQLSYSEVTSTEETDLGCAEYVIFNVHASPFGRRVTEYWLTKKAFNEQLLTLDFASASALLNEIMYWDGSFTRKTCYSSSVRENVDWLQVLAVLVGTHAAKIREYWGNGGVQKKVNYQLDFKTNAYSWTTGAEITEQDYSGDVYCVSVPSSYIVVRREGRPVIVGQCQNWSKGDTEAKNFDDWLRLLNLYYEGKPILLTGTKEELAKVEGVELVDKKGNKKRYKEVGYPNLRWQVKAPPGRWFIGADFKALEARVVALLAVDAWLCKMFSTDADTHAYFSAEAFPEFLELVRDYHKKMAAGAYGEAVAKELDQLVRIGEYLEKEPGMAAVLVSELIDKYKIPKSTEWKNLRDLEKRALYGFLYGAAIMTVWTSIVKEGVSIPAAQVVKLFRVFVGKLAAVPKLHAKFARQAMTEGKVTTFLYGRNRFFPLGEVDETITKNHPIQAGGADVVDTAMIRLVEALKPFNNAWLLLQGHDSLTIECDKEDVAAIRPVMKAAMEQVYEIGEAKVMFSVDCDDGPDWAST